MIKLFIRFGAPYMDGSCQVIGRTLKPSEGSSAQTEGYFCTVEELRELFNAGRDHESNINEFPSFNQWLASKEVKGE